MSDQSDERDLIAVLVRHLRKPCVPGVAGEGIDRVSRLPDGNILALSLRLFGVTTVGNPRERFFVGVILQLR